jgi:hypothetical protein
MLHCFVEFFETIFLIDFLQDLKPLMNSIVIVYSTYAKIIIVPTLPFPFPEQFQLLFHFIQKMEKIF